MTQNSRLRNVLLSSNMVISDIVQLPVVWIALLSLCVISRVRIRIPLLQKNRKLIKEIPQAHKDIGKLKLTHGNEISELNRRKHGPIYAHRDGFRYEVVLTEPDQLKRYYASHVKDHKKLDSFGAGQYLVALLGECVGFQNGERWATMRKSFNTYFTHSLAVKTLPEMVRFISDWMVRYESKTEVLIDAFELVSTVPFVCIAKYLYGEPHCTGQVLTALKGLVPLHSELMTHAFSTFWGRFEFYQYMPFKKMKQLRAFQHYFEDVSMQMVDGARKLGEASVASELYGLVESGELTFANWIQTLDEILFANIDVTATIMAWALVEMAQNPEEQTRLRSEISGSSESRENYCKRTDTALHRVLLEILRLHPLLWYSFPEQCSRNIVIDGFEIAANTPIVIDQHQINYNSPIWNPPDKPHGYGSHFDSDRFIGLNNRDILMSSVTFGSGPRRCLGKSLAEILIKTEITEVLSRFEVSLQSPVLVAKNTFVVRPETRLKLTRI